MPTTARPMTCASPSRSALLTVIIGAASVIGAGAAGAQAPPPTPADISRAQAALRPDEIAITFFLDEPQSFRWVMSKEHAVFDRIAGRAAIEWHVTRLRALLHAPPARADFKAASTALGEMLFEGITTADDRPLIIVPHGVLQQLPFEVLTLQNRLVRERHTVRYAPSLEALVESRRTQPVTGPVGLTILAAALALSALTIVIQRAGAARAET